MQGRTIDLLGLNIGADICVDLKSFHYQVRMEGERRIVDISYQPEPEGEGWISSETLIGEYCGDRHDGQTGQMKIFKLRVREPFNMGSAYGSYMEIDPERIGSIKVLRNGLPTVLDELSHSLSGLGGASLDN